MYTIILIFLFACIFVLLIWALIINKKKEFNSIEVGDKIYYPTTTLEDFLGDSFEEDIIIHIDYNEFNEIERLITKGGLTLTIHEYVREDFFLFRK